MIKKVFNYYKRNGLLNLLKTLFHFFYPQKANSFAICKNLIFNKSGLEIGGPSNIFSVKGLLPLYPYVKSLDNCNFSSETIWEGEIKEGCTYKYDSNHAPGWQFVSEAADLDKISSGRYDFILSSHVIEHIANPVKALFEWERILKDDGILIIIFPHKDGTFDHKRKVTSLEHMIDDFNKGTGENDLTHLDEILELHDLSKDVQAGTPEQFRERSLKNFQNRSLHHHVFNSYSAVKLIDYAGLKIVSVEAALPYHIIIIAKKTNENNNSDLFGEIKSDKFKSPFYSDKSTYQTI
ncbi:MAG TPA: methyltransferase domain-containing protein [Ignavibacteriaceae bacterium]|nr:methyltransferase domain-containing protein [Ignavibacteriaceae bacterium]